MEIIVTDLTRFSNENIVCIAGINPITLECIRPMPYMPYKECRRLNILPGAVLKGNFAAEPFEPPHTEDRTIKGKYYFERPSTDQEFKSILKSTESPSIEQGFSVNLGVDQKHIPVDTPPNKSIITLSIIPQKLQIVPDYYNPEKIRVTLTDKASRMFRYLSITDLGFYNYAVKHCQRDNVSNLNKYIHSQEEVFVRIGLSRKYESADGRFGFWLQVNGIYTFPDYLKEIRCHV